MRNGKQRMVSADDRRSLSGGMYIHLDRRKQSKGDDNASLRSIKRVLGDGQKIGNKGNFRSSVIYDYEEYPVDEYTRKHKT